MTLPSTGFISMSGVAAELGISPIGLSLGNGAVRTLAGVASGPISMDVLHGKSAGGGGGPPPGPGPAIDFSVGSQEQMPAGSLVRYYRDMTATVPAGSYNFSWSVGDATFMYLTGAATINCRAQMVLSVNDSVNETCDVTLIVTNTATGEVSTVTKPVNITAFGSG